ncbi:MAG: DNA mismatch repair endonuclease MutL [Candidatus Hydrogenedentes bacterium]|nr:DNA mismatch repair endonuclease MutL [Candidatus Hydrogenedentota bacterium]
MASVSDIPNVRILPDDVANKIAAGEVVERPASVVKELVENALDARATRVVVRIVAAGRQLIEVQDNGHGMSEQNALLAIERHATSKIRSAQDLDAIKTLGFRGEALASIASVSRFLLTTRRAADAEGTRLRVDGGVLRTVEKTGAPPGSMVSVNRLYFNTPVRAKFLKGIATELGHCIDVVQRHAFAHEGVAFQLFHNDKALLDIPERATLRERVALIWGLAFSREMVEVDAEEGGFRVRGLVGSPGLTRTGRSHQFFFINGRPVVNRVLQYGLADAYRGLLTVGRHPVGLLLIEANPRLVDVNIHPTKREVRFREDRGVHDAVMGAVRGALARVAASSPREPLPSPAPVSPDFTEGDPGEVFRPYAPSPGGFSPPPSRGAEPPPAAVQGMLIPRRQDPLEQAGRTPAPPPVPGTAPAVQPGSDALSEEAAHGLDAVSPDALYEPVGDLPDAPIQVFDTYLIVPSENRLLIIDQHALHERLNYEELRAELTDRGYASQQLAVPLVLEVAPSQIAQVEKHLDLFARLGVEMESFGGNTFQVTAVCHLYEESMVGDLVFRVLDELAQGNLFGRDSLMDDMLRLATRACKASVRAGEPLTPEERKNLLAGLRRLQPPYTCPHGRPIIVELTRRQMEKSFRRIQ